MRKGELIFQEKTHYNIFFVNNIYKKSYSFICETFCGWRLFMVEIVKLKNGVTIVLERISFVRSVSFGIFVKNGSRNETEKTNGISHFIEHMMFKGTEKRTAKQIADDIDSIGGQINAYTTKEYTCYYTRTLDTHFNVAFDVLKDMYFNSLFSDEDIKKERKVIIEEINMYEDTPEELGYDLLQSEIWKGNSIGYPILGTVKSISEFNENIIKEYYKEHYRPDNTVLALAGNFDRDAVVYEIDKYFGKFQTSRPSESDEIYSKPEYFKSIVRKEKDIEQTHLTLCFPGVQSGSDESYILAIVNTVFGGGMSSKLFQKIREEHGLAYTVYSFLSNFVDTGLFSVYAGLNPNQFDQVYSLILKEISDFKREKITETQLVKIKEQLKSNFILSLESSSSRASNIGRSMLILNKVNEVDDIIRKVDKITLEQVYVLIDKIFNLDNLSVSVVGRNIEKLNV